MKTRYTVKVDDRSIDLNAYGTYSAAAHAMAALGVMSAFKVTVISGNGQRDSYINVCLGDSGALHYERRD